MTSPTEDLNWTNVNLLLNACPTPLEQHHLHPVGSSLRLRGTYHVKAALMSCWVN